MEQLDGTAKETRGKVGFLFFFKKWKAYTNENKKEGKT